MFNNGFISEVKLFKNLIKNNKNVSKSIGYKEILNYLETKKTNIDNLQLEINNHTFQLVKKQKTWFKKFIKIQNKNLILKIINLDEFNQKNLNLKTIFD